MAAAPDGTLFLGGEVSGSAGQIIKGRIIESPPYSFEFINAVGFGGSSLVDLKVINGKLYVLGVSGSNFNLLSFDAESLGSRIDVWKDPATDSGNTISTISANIAGWSKDKVYIYYYDTGTPTNYGIYEINTADLSTNASKHWP
jgi:hypothetical protein